MDWQIVLRSCAQFLTAAFGLSNIFWNHVSAHTGDVFNEVADELAKSALNLPPIADPILEWLRSSDTLLHLQWLWLLVPTTHGHPAYPTLRDGQLLHWVSTTTPSCSTTSPTTQSRSPPSQLTTLILATANVLTLDESKEHTSLQPGSRQLALMKQFDEQGCHIVAVQETRHRQARLPQTGDFAVIGHPADSAGHGGIQLWLNLNRRLGPGLRPLCLQDCSVVAATAEWMVCKIRHPGLRCVLVVGHSPHSDRGFDLCHGFWDEISKCLQQHCRQWKLIFLGDANAHLGSVKSEAVGGHHEEPENLAGEIFHQWLLHHGMWTPSTFPEYHDGPSATFLHPSEVGWRRLDYIALDSTLPLQAAHSWVSEDVDLSISRTDHFAVLCRLTLSCTRHRQPLRAPGCDRIALTQWLHQPDTASCLDQSLAMQPAWVDVHSHATCLTDALQKATKSAVPSSFAKPLKRTLLPQTWTLIVEKQAVRKRYFQVLRGLRAGQDRPCHPDEAILQVNLDSCIAQLKSLSSQVKEATRHDDRAFFEHLAIEAGKADSDGGMQNIWKKIRFFLPKHKSKRKTARPEMYSQLLDHFERLEAGSTGPHQDAFLSCVRRQAHSDRQTRAFVNLEELPTLCEIERLCRRQSPGKAAGPDGVASEITHFAAATVAPHIQSLLTKSLVQSKEPFAFKGGRLVALHKGNGGIFQADRYRGILLSSTIAKVNHAWMRSRLLPTFQKVRSAGQLGGRPHQQTAVAVHTLRLHARRARLTKTNTAIIFTDLRSAYHHLLREVVFSIREPLVRADLNRIFDESTFDLDVLAAQLQDN